MLLNDKSHPNHTLTTNTNPLPANTSNHIQHTTDDACISYSSHKNNLTQDTKNVLRKGLTFTPKPKNLTIQNLHKDVNNFMHRMKL